MKKTGGRVVLILGVLFLIIQVIQPDRSNPPVSAEELGRILPLLPVLPNFFVQRVLTATRTRPAGPGTVTLHQYRGWSVAM